MVTRLRGGVAKETFLISIRDFADTEIAEFHEGDRTGNSNGASWTDLTLNDYVWEWEKGRPGILTIMVDDPGRELFDNVKRGYKTRLALDQPMKDCVIAYDMETIDSNGDMMDLSLSGNDGAITGASDDVGWWGRARLFDAETEKIVATGFNYDGFTAWGAGATVRVGNAFASRTNQSIISLHTGSTNAQGTLRLGGTAGGLPTSVQVLINTATQGFQTIIRNFTFVLGETYNIFATWDGTSVRIYVDGVQQGAAAPASGALVNGVTFTVGHNSASDTETFNERIDEIIVYKNRAPTSTEIADMYKRRSRAPRYYFDGIVRKKQHKNGQTTFQCADNLVDAVDQEIYDLIFEGMETDDNTRFGITGPRYARRQIISFSEPDADHDQLHVKFEDLSGATLSNTDDVFSPIILEYPDQSEWFTPTAANRLAIYDNGGGTNLLIYVDFVATAKDLDAVSVLINANGLSGNIQVEVVSKDQPLAPLISGTVAVSGSTATWTFVDMASIGGAELTVDQRYWIGIVLPAGTWTNTNPFFWYWNPDSTRTAKRYSNNVFLDSDDDFAMDIVFKMDNNYKDLPAEEYEIKVSSAGTKIIGDLSKSKIIRGLQTAVTGAGKIDDFFRATYFYSKGDKKVSDVLDRILARVGLTGIYTQTGGLTSDATTTPLGLYIPQGGTAMEHITALAELVQDRPHFIPPNFVQFQRWPEPTTVRNSSFEISDGSGGMLDWTLVQQVGTGSVSQVNTVDTSPGASGNFHPRLAITGNGQTSAEMRFYQDVENFDPVGSGTDGNNLSFMLHRNQSWTGFTFQVTIYDYNSFDNGETFAITAPALGSWEEKRIKIKRKHFRLSFEFLYSGAALGGTTYANFDDVFLHYENLRSFFLVDAGEKDENYNSNRIPGTREVSSEIGVHLLDDYREGPSIQRETSRRMVNRAIVLGDDSEFGTGEPILGIASNPARVSRFGLRSSISRQESLKSSADAYLRAKKLVRFDATFRTSLDMVGQYPFLGGRTIRLFFPQDGLDSATPMEVTNIVVGPKRTLLRFNRSITEQFVDVEKLQERESIMSAAFNSPIGETLFYFDVVDLPTTVDPSAVALARLKDEAGVTSNNISLEAMDTRDAPAVNSVWRMVIAPQDGDTFVTSGTDVWTQVQIRNGSDAFLADITLNQEFAKLKNQWVVIWIFAQ